MIEDPETVARRLADACSGALRAEGRDPIVAAIVHGSLVLGDFVPGASDLDLLVVVDSPLLDAELAAVQSLGERWCEEGTSAIDLRVVTRSAAWRPSRTPQMEVYVGCHGQRTESESRVAEPDLLVELSAARAHGRSLIGSAPASVIGQVPDIWINGYGERLLARWQHLTDDYRHAELMVLTACRIWRFAMDGVHSSKSGAGRWALDRDPALTAIPKALRQRAGDEVTIGAAEIGCVIAAAHAAVTERL